MALDIIDYTEVIVSLIFLIISLIVGLRIAIKYVKYKEKNLLYVGITWILMTEPWWTITFSTLILIATGQYIQPEIYFFIGIGFLPFALILWFSAITNLKYKNKQQLILIIIIIIAIIFEILLIYYIFTNPAMIGELKPHDDGNYDYSQLFSIFLITFLLIFIFSGMIFARESLKSQNQEIKLKGKILIIALLTFLIGAGFEGILAFIYFNTIITRIILTLSAIEFYWGFFLPTWIKNSLLEKKK